MPDRPNAIHAAVTRVNSDDTGTGPSYEITVTRLVGRTYTPDPRDIPTDIRTALRAWLDRADA